MVKAMGKQDLYVIKQAKRAVQGEKSVMPEWLRKLYENNSKCDRCGSWR